MVYADAKRLASCARNCETSVLSCAKNDCPSDAPVALGLAEAEALALGLADGVAVGLADGVADADADGLVVADADGLAVAVDDGVADGLIDGLVDGASVGDAVGLGTAVDSTSFSFSWPCAFSRASSPFSAHVLPGPV